jgi:GNAT superfamily N-acetyltransferase
VTPEPLTASDFAAIIADLPGFWGERDVRHVHHPMFLHEFGDTALVVRDGDRVAAYLLGFVAPGGVGYVHAVGVHRSHRRRGLARALYAAFADLARARGATRMKAITTPANEGSIAFHRALGLQPALVRDYTGPGEDRVVLTGSLDSTGMRIHSGR